MLKNRRGLSDILSNTLIVLLVFVSVSIVGVIILNLVRISGEQIDGKIACNDVKVTPVSCIYNESDANLLFSTERSSKIEIKEVKTVLEYDDGSTSERYILGSVLGNFETNSIKDPDGNEGANRFYTVTTINDKDGNERECVSLDKAECSLYEEEEEIINNPAECGPAAKSYTSDKTVFDGILCDNGESTPPTVNFPRKGESVSWSCNSGSGEVICSARRASSSLPTPSKDSSGGGGGGGGSGPTCSDTCSNSGDVMCSGNGVLTCGRNFDSDNCLEWSTPVACTSNSVCQSGVCVVNNTNVCSDSDGGIKSFLFGRVSFNNTNYTDYCFLENGPLARGHPYNAYVSADAPISYLKEYYCQNNTVKNVDVQCSCKNGVCIQNGLCGSAQNQCLRGDLEDINDSSSHYLWRCIGYNGGVNASCSLSKPNSTPILVITSPRNENSYSTYDGFIPIRITANDSDGTIANIDTDAKLTNLDTGVVTLRNNICNANPGTQGYNLACNFGIASWMNGNSVFLNVTVTDNSGNRNVQSVIVTIIDQEEQFTES